MGSIHGMCWLRVELRKLVPLGPHRQSKLSGRSAAPSRCSGRGLVLRPPTRPTHQTALCLFARPSSSAGHD